MMGNKNVGFNTYQDLKRVEKMANDLGFMFDRAKHHGYNIDSISLYPMDDSLPLYSRDSQIFTGDLGEVEAWVLGAMWARNYDIMLKVSDSKKRERKEQDERNRRLAMILKQGKVEE